MRVYLYLLWLSIAVFVLGVVPLLAQGTGEPLPPVFGDLGTIGSIIIAATLLVSVTKKVAGNVAVISKLPVWVFAVVYSLGLCYLANQITGTLPGDFGPLAWEAVKAALASTGFYEWVISANARNTKLAETTTARNLK